MDGSNYFASLKNKEFLILQQLCDDSISQAEKEKMEKELKKVRIEIKKLE
ncbi:MAG: hypothetical protein OEM28_06190 [Nitrosopumilus sp.]|nr:hypothetical protein [Nitrosopumilus sp.]MDH3487528.1 hypothetical protein [Nitrosopumilus sp.]